MPARGWRRNSVARNSASPAATYSGLRLLQTLESLALGITGKRLLWRALHAVRQSSPALQQMDFEYLEKRAIEQSNRVEIKRLETARAVLHKE